MRLHRLEITAFGPFADTVGVDFDALGEAGLFLVTGSTGAGKTSLLDAVCFALFGQVPGDRQQAARLRCDAAAPASVPRVEMVVSVAGRRLRFVRSPAWQRPKARGTGTTPAQATALAEEWRAGGWETLATRIPDVSQLAASVMGMDVHQFTQVVMLPQGRFQEFLRSGSDSRKAVLERLFATSRFRDVERWLVWHRQQTGRTDAEHHRAAATLADQIAAVAATDGPGDDSSCWCGWATATAVELARRARAAAVRVSELHERVRGCRRSLEDHTRRTSLRESGVSAQAALDVLDAQREHVAQAQQRLDSSDQAREVVALLDPLDEAERAVHLSLQAVDLMRGVARRTGSVLPPDDLPLRKQVAAVDGLRAATEADLSSLRTWSELVASSRILRAKLADLLRQQQQVAARRAHLLTRLNALAEQIEQLRDALAQARTTACGIDRIEAQLHSARAVLSAAQALPEARDELNRRHQRLDAAVTQHNDARDVLNDLRDRRLAGAAIWLASSLTAGAPCPVCGGCEHPAPAAGTDGVPDEADEHAARAEVATAARKRDAATAEHDGAQTAWLTLQGRAAGADIESALATVESLAAEHQHARQAAAAAEEVSLRLVEREAELTGLGAELLDHDAELASLTEQVGLRRGQLEALLDRHPEGDPDETDATLDVDLAEAGARLDALEQLAPKLRDLVTAQRVATTARRHAEQAAHDGGFADLDAARAAALPPAQRDELHGVLERYRAAVQEATATRDDPEVQTALGTVQPDVAAVRTILLDAEREHAAALEAAGQLRSRSSQVTALAGALDAAMAAWHPVRRDHEVADAMAALAEGKSADNHLQMSLSAYVLAARLSQVVDSANERLAPMTSGRYTLEHSLDRTAGDRTRAGGGLGLLVHDSWSGHSREPKTLSGGEMFQASLALALGLADVVTHESGGLQMQSLFVDEGFGSLDGDSLDEVMDVLDDLRCGGRVVGVVSHVETMRERIPAQVRVTKARSGSTVQQT